MLTPKVYRAVGRAPSSQIAVVGRLGRREVHNPIYAQNVDGPRRRGDVDSLGSWQVCLYSPRGPVP